MGFRIKKITPGTGTTCDSCGKQADYEITINTIGTRFCLCKECTWVLSDGLDKTTSKNFKYCEVK